MFGAFVLASLFLSPVTWAAEAAYRYQSLADIVQLIENPWPLIVLYESYILIVPQGLRLSPAPDSSDLQSLVASLHSTDRIPLVHLEPSRKPNREPILYPPPPPLHLLATTLFPIREENEYSGPPELKPKPPRPPPLLTGNQSLGPIMHGTDILLPPKPSP